MILSTKTNKDTQGKNRKFNYYQCTGCNNLYSKQARFAGSINEFYCSTKCANNARLYTEVKCSHCNILFKKLTSRLSGSKSGLYFCCREHKDLAQSYIKDIQPDHYGSGKYNYRSKALNNFGAVCNRCGFTNILALEVHHKDKNRDNNDISNLEVLCCNCHSIEHGG